MIQIFDKKGFTVLHTLDRPTLHDADLGGCELSEANMVQYDLRNTRLEGANLRDADLRLARLDQADLRNADLSNANLSGANLSKARLQGAILDGATLTDAELPADFHRQQPGKNRLASIRISTDNGAVPDNKPTATKFEGST
jgi:uncharacterized protein YjbI with pentapeptide repeats